MDELMAIGEFSAQSGLSAKVLRSYAAAGLLVPAAVDRWSGYRYYGSGQLPEARLILLLRQAGVPLSERELPVKLCAPAARRVRNSTKPLVSVRVTVKE